MSLATRRSYALDWGRIAPFYDLQLRLERPALRAAVDLLDVRDGETVIDVGTGTAAFLRELAGRDLALAGAVGIDSSARMLRRATGVPPGWQLVQGDAAALPFADASVDAAACTYLLHLLPSSRRDSALRELHRVLRPGGRVVTVTPATPRSRLGRPWTAVVDLLSAALPMLFLGLRPLDLIPALRQAGLRPEHARYVPRGYPSLCVLARRCD